MKEREGQKIEEILQLTKRLNNGFQASVECPPDADLFGYVHKEFPEAQQSEIERHVKQCLHCRAKVLEMDVERIEWEEMLEGAYQEGLKRLSDAVHEPADQKPKNLPGKILGTIWEPFETFFRESAESLTGQLAPSMAAEIVSNHHIFNVIDGQIKLEYSWKNATPTRPAFIEIIWRVEIGTSREIDIKFIDPESRETKQTFHLKTTRSGSARFTKEDLGFDFMTERWAISIE